MTAHMEDMPAITTARRAYTASCEVLERRITERDTAVQALADAQFYMSAADRNYDDAVADANKAFDTLRLLVAEAREAGQS